nr:phosphatase PAP2 family protein [Lentilactobacillus rapi]
MIRRHRPPLHLGVDSGYSFPSGHVLGVFLVISIIWIVVVPVIDHASVRFIIRALMIVWLILVMFSRIYLNAHYPTDTLGAALVAYCWLLVSEMLYINYAPKVARYRFVIHTKI